MDELGNNLKRLLGLHALTARDAAALIGLSAQAISEIQASKRGASYPTARSLAKFFEMSTDRLADTPFVDLLATELADPERYKRVEQKIRPTRTQQKPRAAK